MQKLGIDIRQWAALTKALIRKDFRESSASTVLRYGRSGGRAFLSLIFFYFLVGLVFIPIILMGSDIFISGTMLITYTMFMIGSLLLVEYHTVVLSPDDYLVLGYQPISSRTFFAVKICNVLFYVLTFTLVLSLPGVITFCVVPNGGVVVCVVAFCAAFLANLTITLVVILFYVYILKTVSLARLQNILAFFQIGLALSIYSGFIFLPRLVDEWSLQALSLDNTPWLVLLPSSWFGSYLAIASGTFTFIHVLLATLSFCVLAIVSISGLGHISMAYSARLAALASLSNSRKAASRRFSRLFTVFANAHEERVVAKLIRNQFLHDNKFKMAVLGILPLTVFYLFLGVQEGPLSDPFVTPKVDISRSGLLYLLVFLFPMMLRTFVTQSDAYQASWIFYTTPIDIRRIVLAEKNFLMVYFVLPLLMILGAVFQFYFDNILHVLLHLLILGLLSHLFLQFAFLYSPDLPFSRPNVKGQRSRNVALLLIIVPFVVYLGLPFIFKHVYTNLANYLVLTMTVFVISVVLESLIKVRVETHIRRTEFPA